MQYRRTVSILNKNYLRFMIPAILSAVGIALSEFADSMVVSHLLGSDAFAVINLGTPLVFIVSMIYTVTGIGGSLIFAECLGRKEKHKADSYFSVSTALALFAGAVFLALLILFHPVLGSLSGCPGELRTQFDKYIGVLRFFVPAGILLMHLSYFLPIVGKPFFSMVLVVSVNLLNVVLDIVFIRGFSMGCEGAAAATLVSYLMVLAVTVLVWRIQNIPLTFRRTGSIGSVINEIIKKGAPSGSVQIGYAVTTVFCNFFLNRAFGINGVVAMSLFAQLDSVISIALTGIVDNNASFAAMLKGEGDYYGIRALSRRVAIMIVLVCSVLSAVFFVFPDQVAAVFNIHDPGALSLIRKLIGIYVLYYPLRGILLVLRDIYNTLDRSLYATVLGVLDKVISIPLVGGILYLIFGGYGVIAAFPISMILILCLVAAVNHRIVKNSAGRYSPVLLLDEAYPKKVLCSYSVQSLEDAAGIGEFVAQRLAEFCPDGLVIKRICLAAEEISLYIIEHVGAGTAADYLISSSGGDYTLTCRNPGPPFCPFYEKDKTHSLNELLLTGMFGLRHEYIFGLNSTSLTIGVQKTKYEK